MNDINFVEVDAEKISNELITRFEAAYGETLYPSDERRIFLQQMLPVIIALKNDINNSAKMNLLRYATGSQLDALGDFYNTPRIQAKRSKVLCRISLSSIQLVDISISKGKRITPDGVIFFSLIKDTIIPVGMSYVDTEFEATEAGSNYNNFIPGQIKTIVDPIPYVVNIENISTSSNGADIENDERYRERIRLAPESFSVAGPEGAYEYWAKSTDVSISDVAVNSPSPGVVKITVLQEGGLIPSEDILNAVYATVSAKNRRPLTDNVQVQAPTTVSYNIQFTYYILEENKTDELSIKNSVENVINDFVNWQQSGLGKAINPDYLRKLVLNAGANRIIMTAPVYTIINEDALAKVANVNIVYGGLE